jgi:pyoverdine/dityrosine biosynthesis protein Dit1
VLRAEPIVVVTPSMAKIGAWPKLMTSNAPTAAEEVSMEYLGNLARLATTFYSPGVHFVNLSDARLYNPYLGNPEPVIACYIRGLGEIIEKRNLLPFVQVAYYDELLADHSRQFERLYAEAYQQYREDSGVFFSEGEREPIFQSLHAIPNR